MSWNFRIIHYRKPEAGYGLHEVYYNEGGTVVNMGAAPAIFVADQTDGPSHIIDFLKRALDDAQQRPVLEEPDWIT